MSLFTRAVWSLCVCCCTNSAPADAWVLLSHRCVEDSRGERQDALYPLLHSTWVSFSPAHTHTHTVVRQHTKAAHKVLLNGGLFGKRALEKPDPFKVLPEAGSWTTRGIFTGPLSLSSLSEWRHQRCNGNSNLFISLLFPYRLFLFFICFFPTLVKTSVCTNTDRHGEFCNWRSVCQFGHRTHRFRGCSAVVSGWGRGCPVLGRG